MRVPPPVNFAQSLAPSEVARLRDMLLMNEVPIYAAETALRDERLEKFAAEAQALGRCGRYLTATRACDRAAGHVGDHTDDPSMIGL